MLVVQKDYNNLPDSSSRSPLKLTAHYWNLPLIQEALHFLFFEDTYTFWGGHPWGTNHPPNPPSSAPTQAKRVPICSFSNSASICILIKIWSWNVAELRGKNWDTDVHAHKTYQAPQLACTVPNCFHQNSTDYLMLAQSCKFGVNCCYNGLTHPAAYTRAREFQSLDMSTDPFLNTICPNRVPID
jgi:hypothetical protein